MVGLSDLLQDELKKNTADVNNLDGDGRTALHYVVLHNFINFVTLLLAYPNVNLNIRYRLWLISAYHRCSERPYVKLLNSSSQICVSMWMCVCDDKMRTPLHDSMWDFLSHVVWKRCWLIQALLWMHRITEGRLCCTIASLDGQIYVFVLLLLTQKDICVDIYDHDNNTLLFYVENNKNNNAKDHCYLLRAHGNKWYFFSTPLSFFSLFCWLYVCYHEHIYLLFTRFSLLSSRINPHHTLQTQHQLHFTHFIHCENVISLFEYFI